MLERPTHERCKRSAGCKHCMVTAPLSSGNAKGGRLQCGHMRALIHISCQPAGA